MKETRTRGHFGGKRLSRKCGGEQFIGFLHFIYLWLLWKFGNNKMVHHLCWNGFLFIVHYRPFHIKALCFYCIFKKTNLGYIWGNSNMSSQYVQIKKVVFCKKKINSILLFIYLFKKKKIQLFSMVTSLDYH